MAWTLVPSIVEKSKQYVRWKLHCVSDGAALAATDIFSETYMPRDMKPKVQGLSYMRMEIVPGTGSVIPNTTINVTLSNSVSSALFTMTGASKDAASHHDLSTDIAMYPTFFASMYLTINDVGDSGDELDLYFECWKEPGNA
jgi:hypothetical protein